MGLSLVADSSYYYPCFYMGLRQGSMRELPMESSYTQIFDGERYYELSGKEAAVVRDDFFCYHLTTGFNLDLGERVSIDGMELSGQVISTEGEKCELALDIEPEQAGGYRYSFAPETGNFMYCMPQAQT